MFINESEVLLFVGVYCTCKYLMCIYIYEYIYKYKYILCFAHLQPSNDSQLNLLLY